MDITHLKEELKKFRQAAIALQKEDDSVIYANPFAANSKFPYESCLTVSKLLYLFLKRKHNISKLKLGYGNSSKGFSIGCEHYWLELEDKYYLDITADQFTENENDAVIVDVKENNKFYNQFRFGRNSEKIDIASIELNDLVSRIIEKMESI